jgi:hypothetical protein
MCTKKETGISRRKVRLTDRNMCEWQLFMKKKKGAGLETDIAERELVNKHTHTHTYTNTPHINISTHAYMHIDKKK